jgi:outer membrane protein assembly factor BamD (BamD/ComL family)
MMADARHSISPALQRARGPLYRTVRVGRRLFAHREADPEYHDVWTRTQPKYRRRAVLLLVINGVLFFGLGCFGSWLRTGVAVPFLAPDYWDYLWRCFNPAGPEQATLIDFVIFPINVEQVPMQVLVLALLLASLVSIPILVAMLYRLPFAIPFILIVAFVGMFPWLAITLTISCVMTAIRPLRFSVRYATALIALIPAVLYLFGATRNPTDAARYATPIVSAALYAPSVLAVLASCLVMAIVLLIAWLVDYRPGAIAPLLAMMFALPVVLFEAQVGRDELYYRLLEREYGPHSQVYFRDMDASSVIHELAVKKWEQSPPPRRDVEAYEEEIKLLWRYELDPLDKADALLNEFQLHQWRAARACDKFRADYPRSRYLPNVLYMKGRALDMRVDLEAFRRDAILRFYEDFPSHTSESTWGTLCKAYPDSPVAAVALYRLAKLEGRRGDIDGAIRRLTTLIERFSTTTRPAAPNGGSLLARLERPPPTSTLDIDIAGIVHKGRKLYALLRSNRDPHLAKPPEIKADAPLVEFLRCDPQHRKYRENLVWLLDQYPYSRMRARLHLELALTERSTSLKIRELEDFIRRYGESQNTNALAEAHYVLGEAYLWDRRPVDARAAFESVVNQYADTVWAEDARRQLARMTPLESVQPAT